MRERVEKRMMEKGRQEGNEGKKKEGRIRIIVTTVRAYCIPNAVLSALHIFSHISLTTHLGGGCNYYYYSLSHG